MKRSKKKPAVENTPTVAVRFRPQTHERFIQAAKLKDLTNVKAADRAVEAWIESDSELREKLAASA